MTNGFRNEMTAASCAVRSKHDVCRFCSYHKLLLATSGLHDIKPLNSQEHNCLFAHPGSSQLTSVTVVYGMPFGTCVDQRQLAISTVYHMSNGVDFDGTNPAALTDVELVVGESSVSWLMHELTHSM